MLFRLLLAAAEESRDLQVPPAQRPIGRALLKCRIELQHRHELVANVAAVFQPLPQAERLRERTHIRSDPEMPFRAVRLTRYRYASCGDARFEKRLALVRGAVASQPE